MLKKLYLEYKGYIYYKKYRWWVNVYTSEAIDNKCSLWNIYMQNIKYKKLGSWTFYAPSAKMNVDILDTLRDEFSPKITIRKLLI